MTLGVDREDPASLAWIKTSGFLEQKHHPSPYTDGSEGEGYKLSTTGYHKLDLVRDDQELGKAAVSQ